MKSSILFSLLASTLLISACGKDSDSKKSQTQPQVRSGLHHVDNLDGRCMEATTEELASKGMEFTDEAKAGACPQQLTLQGNSIQRYADCPATFDDGVQGTVVIYTKVQLLNGTLFDVTQLTTEQACEQFAK